MKLQLLLLSYLLVLLVTLASCSKTGTVRPNYPPSTENNTYTVGQTVGNRVYYWGLRWVQTARGQEILITSPQVTDSTILRGIHVNLAPYSNWDPFGLLPTTFQGVAISYILKPDTLQIISNANSLFDYPSDVMIEFQ